MIDQPTGTDRPVPSRRKGRFVLGEFAWVWVGFALLILVSVFVAPGTLNIANLAATSPFAAILVVAAVGQTLVIQQGGLDFSVAGTLSLAALVMTKVESGSGSLPAGLLAAVALAVAVGVVNSLVVSKLSVTPIVATLAMNAVLIGAAFAVSGGAFPPTSPGWTAMVRSAPLGIPSTVIVAVVVVTAAAFVMRRTVGGRGFLIAGAGPQTSRAAGRRVEPYRTSAYVVSALCAALAGVLLAGFTGSATPDLGNPYLLTTVAAVVIGGTPFVGGRGSVIATAGGALFLTQLSQLTLAMGAPAATQLFVQAAALILAVSIRNLSLQTVRGWFGRGGRDVTPSAEVTPT